MTIIHASKVRIYSLPIEGIHKPGYDVLVKRVCEVKNAKGVWSGFIAFRDIVVTIGEFGKSDSEFDISFRDGHKTIGFKTTDMGGIIEVGLAKAPDPGAMYVRMRHPRPGDVLFTIGNFFGEPYELAQAQVARVFQADHLFTPERWKKVDTFSCGSPVFDQNGALCGIIMGYVEETDAMVILALYVDNAGTIKNP